MKTLQLRLVYLPCHRATLKTEKIYWALNPSSLLPQPISILALISGEMETAALPFNVPDYLPEGPLPDHIIPAYFP